MESKIELDYRRLMDYQKLKNNLIAVEDHFRVGDILIKEVNSILQNVKDMIDLGLDTSFTPQDFNDMLNLRNQTLAPIFQNASFAVEFNAYDVSMG